jgi:thiamine-monophosphate kinase
VSDGLSLDLSRVAEESGCGAVIDPEKIPVARAAYELAGRSADNRTPLDHALSDGEDFELILAMPSSAARELVAKQPVECGCTEIGHFVAELGLWVEAAGARRPLAPRGFEHRLNQ